MKFEGPKKNNKESREQNLERAVTWGTEARDPRHSELNEDTGTVDAAQGFFAVYDGMGGHENGQAAAHTARQIIERCMQGIGSHKTPQEVERAVAYALYEANAHLARLNHGKKTLEQMGTTAVVVKICRTPQGEPCVVVGHIGDSRLYAQNQSNQLIPLTLDHTRSNQQVAEANNLDTAWDFQSELSNLTDLTNRGNFLTEAFDRRNVILKKLGTATIAPTIQTYSLNGLKKLFLCSDGITDPVTDRKLETALHCDDQKEGLAKIFHQAKTTTGIRSRPDDKFAIIVDLTKFLPEFFTQPQAPTRLPIPHRKKEFLTHEQAIAETQSVEQLMTVLNKIGGVQGTQQFYTPGIIIRQINEISRGEKTIFSITSTLGLRNKVAELLNIDLE